MTRRARSSVLLLVLGAPVVVGGVSRARAQTESPPSESPPSDAAPDTSSTPAATPGAPVSDAARAAPPRGQAPRAAVVRHLPGAQASRDHATLAFEVTHPDRLGALVVRWRHAHEPVGVFHEEPVRRAAARWEALLPPEALAPPGLEYWVVERAQHGRGSDRAVFASEREPRFLGTWPAASDAHEQDALALRGGRRSSLSVRGEYVEFGTRELCAETCSDGWPDRYWHLEASYAYSFFTHVEQIRLSVGTVRGNAGNEEDAYELAATGVPPVTDIGIQYGRAEITWYLVDLVRARTSVLLGFSTEGFELGAGAELIVGHDLATHLALGVEGTSSLGVTGRLRLEWWTLPRVPMGATVEATTFPTGSDAGVRLLYDVGYVLYPGALLRVRGGYQGRTSVTGGPALGGEAVFAF